MTPDQFETVKGLLWGIEILLIVISCGISILVGLAFVKLGR